MGLNSIFDKVKPEDFVFAFFPCTRFEDQIHLRMRGVQYQQKNDSDEKKLNADLYLHRQLHENYERVTKLAIVCLRIGVPLVIENPFSSQHYLTKFWPIEPKVIDMDRRKNGDYMKKPTQYFFIGTEPKDNLVFDPLEPVEERIVEKVVGGKARARIRSEIHPQYARWFIKTYIATEDAGVFTV